MVSRRVDDIVLHHTTRETPEHSRDKSVPDKLAPVQSSHELLVNFKYLVLLFDTQLSLNLPPGQ